MGVATLGTCEDVYRPENELIEMQPVCIVLLNFLIGGLSKAIPPAVQNSTNCCCTSHGRYAPVFAMHDNALAQQAWLFRKHMYIAATRVMQTYCLAHCSILSTYLSVPIMSSRYSSRPVSCGV